MQSAAAKKKAAGGAKGTDDTACPTSARATAAPEPMALTEEEMKAKVEEALAKALADTEDARRVAWQQQVASCTHKHNVHSVFQ